MSLNFATPVRSVLPTPFTLRVKAFASHVVADEAQRRRLDISACRGEFISNVAGAVHDFVTIRAKRFKRFASQILSRFATDRLPGSTVRAVRRVAVAAFEACLARITAPKPTINTSRADPVPRMGTRKILVAAPTAAPVELPQMAWRTHYREAVTGSAQRAVTMAMADTEITEDLRAELAAEAGSIIGGSIAKRQARFPRLGSGLLARFIAGTLPRSTSASLRREACLGVRSIAERRLSRSWTRVFDGWETPLALLAKIDNLLEKVRRTVAHNENAVNVARTHIALLEKHRADVLAAA